MSSMCEGCTAGPIELDDEVLGTVAGMRDMARLAGRTADDLSQAFRAWIARQVEVA